MSVSEPGDGLEKPVCGGPARGYSWPPFEEGNQVALRHGAYSEIALAPRAAELREVIGGQLDPADAAEFSLLVGTAAAVGAQVERAFLALQNPVDPATSERLGRDARGWTKIWLSTLRALGLTPAEARQAARDAGHARLAEHLARHYAADVEGEVEDA